MSETPLACSECARAARRLRGGRCDACYMRRYRRKAIVPGARCAGCDERRRHVLVAGHVGGRSHVLCGNCQVLLARASPRLEDLGALRVVASRERRDGSERRVPAPRGNVHERRRAPRRDGDRAGRDPFNVSLD